MKDYARPDRKGEDTPSFDMESVAVFGRLAATVLGLIVIVVGLVYAAKIFVSIYDTLWAPETLKAPLAKWADAVGGEDLDVELEGQTYHAARGLAVLVVVVFNLILAWISMGIMLTGAKIVSWTSSEREAVKKILKHALGASSATKPKPPPLAQ